MALVYRGPASLPGCPEAVAALLRVSRWGFAVRFVGPDGDVPLTASALDGATVYAQPGGVSLTEGYRQLRRHRQAIRDFVRSGGRYLGFCLGGYLAGATPGFDLLPGDTDQYISTPDASVTSTKDTTVEVFWRGQRRSLFFQDGPCFLLRRNAPATVVARYPNGAVAAVVAGFGSGRVAVVGPHPEATTDWFIDAGLEMTDPLGVDLGVDLIDALMQPWPIGPFGSM